MYNKSTMIEKIFEAMCKDDEWDFWVALANFTNCNEELGYAKTGKYVHTAVNEGLENE
jgi:hypothetical protein